MKLLRVLALGLIAVVVCASTSSPRTFEETWGQRALIFEPNVGQFDSRVRFVARAAGATVFLTEADAVISLADGDGTRAGVLRMRFSEAAPPAVRGVVENAARANYLHGADRAAWRTGVATYRKVEYAGVHAGVSAVFYGADGGLEYDFVVAPGANPAVIAVDFDGAEDVAIDERGDVRIRVAGRTIRQRRPEVYQDLGGTRRTVAARYVQRGPTSVGFAVGAYDSRLPLVIDPVLEFSTYLGGRYHESVRAVALDGDGFVYVAGLTQSADFPVTPGAFQEIHGRELHDDAFVAKLTSAGAVVYATYLGGRGDDAAAAVAVDGAGSVYVAGHTRSANFPTVNPIQTYAYGGDVFVAKLSVDGSDLDFSTYFGGPNADSVTGIGVDGSGHVYFTGTSNSPGLARYLVKLDLTTPEVLYQVPKGGAGFVVTPAGHQYVLTGSLLEKIGPTGSTVYAIDVGAAVSGGGRVALDPAGNAYLALDDVVKKVSADGSTIVYSFAVGAGMAAAIGVDDTGSAYIAGVAPEGLDDDLSLFPFADGRPAIVAKIDRQATGLVYATSLTSTTALLAAIAVAGDGSVYAAGNAPSPHAPMRHGQAAFIAKLAPFDTRAVRAEAAIALLDDVGGDSGRDVAVALRDPATGLNLVHVSDPRTRRRLRTVTFFDASWSARAIMAVPDVNGNGVGEVAMLGVKTDGATHVLVKDAASGVFVSRIVFEPNLTPVGHVVLPDVGDQPAIAVLGVDGDGTPRAQVRSAATGALISAIVFTPTGDCFSPPCTAVPTGLAAVADLDGNGVAELVSVVHVVTAGGGVAAVAAQIRDAMTGALVANIPFARQFPARALVTFNDFSGNGAREIGVVGAAGGLDASDSPLRFQLRDSATQQGLVESFLLGSTADVMSARAVADVTGDGIPELLWLARVDGWLARITVTDITTGTTIRRFDSDPRRVAVRAMHVLPDMNGNGSREIGVLEVVKSTGTVRLRKLDPATGQDLGAYALR